MNIKEFEDMISSPVLAEDVPIIVLDVDDNDVAYDVRLEQNRFGRWAVFIDILE